MNYKNGEMCNTYFIYGLANRNSLQAMHIYEEKYVNCVIPPHTMFFRLHHLANTGNLKVLAAGNGRSYSASTLQRKKCFMKLRNFLPLVIYANQNISQLMVLRILKNQLCIQWIQAVLPGDFHG